MKLGFGLYRHQLDADHFRFAKQCGATHLVIHWVDYFRSSRNNEPGDQPLGDDFGWGMAGDPGKLWSFDELSAVKAEAESHGLVIEAIENFDPAHWHDVLLDGPKKEQQLKDLKTIIRTVGRVGIPVIGYNFSIAGVAGRVKGPWGRGGAEVVAMKGPYNTPIPTGMVWNMVYDKEAPAGELAPVSTGELWRRHGEFLDALLPVAEEAGVILAAHPDDPPTPTLRGQPRLVNQPQLYQKLIDGHDSPSNGLEFCLGTLAEMTDGNIYDAVESYSRQKKVAYIHFRNVRGKVPNYVETFVDEGDIDMLRVLRILKKNGFTGVLIPDHAPQMTCSAPWHAGMAYACGWMKAALTGTEHFQ
jgi:mannonate dehydratase